MVKTKDKNNTRGPYPIPTRTPIIKKKQCKSKSKSNDMTNPIFRKKVIELLNYEEMKQKFEETSV